MGAAALAVPSSTSCATCSSDGIGKAIFDGNPPWQRRSPSPLEGLKAIFAMESPEARLPAIRRDDHVPAAGVPGRTGRRIRTNNMIERLNREIGRRAVVGSFPDGNSALMLV